MWYSSDVGCGGVGTTQIVGYNLVNGDPSGVGVVVIVEVLVAVVGAIVVAVGVVVGIVIVVVVAVAVLSL